MIVVFQFKIDEAFILCLAHILKDRNLFYNGILFGVVNALSAFSVMCMNIQDCVMVFAKKKLLKKKRFIIILIVKV